MCVLVCDFSEISTLAIREIEYAHVSYYISIKFTEAKASYYISIKFTDVNVKQYRIKMSVFPPQMHASIIISKCW